MVPKLLCILLALVVVASLAAPAFSQRGSRPAYAYDRADVISSEYESEIDSYLRGLDDSTTNEIVIYTIPSFVGHGITKDGVEIQDRDMLANYIYNELTLDGIKGIGKKGKDNGILILMSLERDVGGGSIRIEIGRGLEGTITDGTAGEILDRYLVPAREQYESTGVADYDEAFLYTVVALGLKMGYEASDSNTQLPPEESAGPDYTTYVFVALIVVSIVVAMARRRGRRYGGYYGGWGGGYRGGGGGGFGGGGGGSGGGGAGR